MSKNKLMNIRISEEQDKLLRKIGGHTKGFEALLSFYLDNYQLAKQQEKERAKAFSNILKSGI